MDEMPGRLSGFSKVFFSELCLGIVDILLVDMQLFIQISVRSLYAMVRLEWFGLQMARS